MSNHDPLTLKLSLREKCAYGVGDFGSNLMLCIRYAVSTEVLYR